MGRITAIINQKGECGKTSTAHALSTGLKMKGYSVLVVDCDPQGNLSYAMRAYTSEKGLYEAISGTVPTSELIQQTEQGDIIASSSKLNGADKEFNDTGREYLLNVALEPIKENYSHIILDCPPQLSILTINALCCCTDAVITLTSDMFALQGLSQLSATINKVRQFCGKQVEIAGLLLCRHSNRSILSRDLKQVIEEKAVELDTNLYKTIIRDGVSVRESQTQRESLFTYAKSSNPAIDYEDFINEYLNQEKGR